MRLVAFRKRLIENKMKRRICKMPLSNDFYGEEQLRQTSLKADGMRAVKESVL